MEQHSTKDESNMDLTSAKNGVPHRPLATKTGVPHRYSIGPGGTGSWDVLGGVLGGSQKRLGGVVEASWAVLGRERWPTWLQLGFQNGAPSDARIIAKQMVSARGNCASCSSNISVMICKKCHRNICRSCHIMDADSCLDCA